MKNNFEYSEAEKHCNTKITTDIESMRGLWKDATDNQRLEIIKSVIWTAPNMEQFYDKVLKTLDREKFGQTLD